jgi:hypothetical protein
MMSAIKPQMQRFWRKRRIEEFIKRVRPCNGSRIVDLGGLPQYPHFSQKMRSLTSEVLLDKSSI